MIQQLKTLSARKLMNYSAIAIVILSLVFLFLPNTAAATNTVGEKTTILTIAVNDNGDVTTAATLSIADLQALPQVRYLYSTIDNSTTVVLYAAEGVLLTDILTAAGVDLADVYKFTFTATDNYTRTLTRQYLLDTQRYYYPNLPDNFSTIGGTEVPPILALRSASTEDGSLPSYDLMDDYYSARLFFGQTETDLCINQHFVKWTSNIEVFTSLNTLQPPTLCADYANNGVGDPVTLTFTDDAAWRGAVNDVTVDGVSTPLYVVNPGSITLMGSLFSSEKDYAITVEAEGYMDASVTQHKGPWPLSLPLKEMP
jgi:hypothetical protein